MKIMMTSEAALTTCCEDNINAVVNVNILHTSLYGGHVGGAGSHRLQHLVSNWVYLIYGLFAGYLRTIHVFVQVIGNVSGVHNMFCGSHAARAFQPWLQPWSSPTFQKISGTYWSVPDCLHGRSNTDSSTEISTLEFWQLCPRSRHQALPMDSVGARQLRMSLYFLLAGCGQDVP